MKSNGVTLGQGAGRVVKVKDLIAEINDTRKIIFIDPKKDYENLASRSYGKKINPLEIRRERK